MASIPRPTTVSSLATDRPRASSQQDAAHAQITTYFFWPILASAVNILINLIAWVAENYEEEHLLPMGVSLCAVCVLLFAYKTAQSGRLMQALSIMTVTVALDSLLNVWLNTYGGIVTVFAPLLVFVLILPKLQSKTAQLLAIFNGISTFCVIAMLIVNGLHDETKNAVTTFMLVVGATVVLIGIYRVLTQHQLYMAQAIADLQVSNKARGKLAQQLRQQTDKLQDRSLHLETLNDITQNVMQQLSIDDMLRYIMQRAADLVQTQHSAVLLADTGGDHLIVHYGSGIFHAIRGNRLSKYENSLAINVWQTGKPEVNNDYTQSTYRSTSLNRFGIKAVVGIPLMHNKQIIGVLEFAHNTIGAQFNNEQVVLLNQLSHLASLAYANSQLYVQAQAERDVARRVMKTMGQGLALISKEGAISFANPALTSLLGYGVDTLTGVPFDNLFANEEWTDQPRYQRTHQAQAFSGQYLLRRRDGTTVPALISYPPQMVESSLDETVCVFTDLTQIKAFQDNMKEARDQALHMVELKTGFLATVSHELRTPLHSIEGYLELLLDTPLDGDQISYAKTAFDASVNLNEIINEVLDFSKLEGKAMQLQLVAANVRTVLDTVIATLNSKAMQKNLILNHDVNSQVPAQLMLDSQRLRQILLNLAGNALKFTQEGGVQIRVQPQSVSDGAITLLFSVIDTGIGISKTDQKRIFQPFMQADNTATRSFGGTGLGLAIVKSLVELMGGEVGVQSEIGKGSRFWFTIVAPIVANATPAFLSPPTLSDKLSRTPVTITDVSLQRQTAATLS